MCLLLLQNPLYNSFHKNATLKYFIVCLRMCIITEKIIMVWWGAWEETGGFSVGSDWLYLKFQYQEVGISDMFKINQTFTFRILCATFSTTQALFFKREGKIHDERRTERRGMSAYLFAWLSQAGQGSWADLSSWSRPPYWWSWDRWPLPYFVKETSKSQSPEPWDSRESSWAAMLSLWYEK